MDGCLDKRRICPSYAQLWAYDWRIVLLETLIAYNGKAVPIHVDATWGGRAAVGSLPLLASGGRALLRRAWVRDREVAAPVLE